MEELSQGTKERLVRFSQSEKFNQLNPNTQTRLTNFLGKSQESPFQQLGGLLKEAGQRTVREGPTSFNTITGGPAVAFQSNLKSSLFEKVGMQPEMAQSLASATDPQSILIAQMMNKGLFSKTGMPRASGSYNRLQ